MVPFSPSQFFSLPYVPYFCIFSSLPSTHLLLNVCLIGVHPCELSLNHHICPVAGSRQHTKGNSGKELIAHGLNFGSLAPTQSSHYVLPGL